MKPERIVHIGLGAFFRAHQAVYTQHASDGADWGIVAYTGRSALLADQLRPQGCKYTLVVKTAEQDSLELIDSVVRVEAAENVADLIATISNPDIAIVTLTITEAGYQPSSEPMSSYAIGRLAMALDARQKAGHQAPTLLSCDNMPDNSEVLRKALLVAGSALGSDFQEYVGQVSYVSSSVDRITPKTTDDDIALVAATGFPPAAPVITEEFSDWVVSGSFPLGRPNWESAGARFVAELEPWENRKLWLLNGAHSLIASFGQRLGYQSVDQAIQDVEIRAAVDAWWSDASEQLPAGLDIENYKQSLLKRFSNPRISHRLEQISLEGLTKHTVRFATVAEESVSKGVMPLGAVGALASYIASLGLGFGLGDSRSQEINKALASNDQVLSVLALISPKLAANAEFVQLLKLEVAALSAALTSDLELQISTSLTNN
jgi:fructuronate reductase